MSTRTDEQLMEAARSGDDKAVDELLARHEEQVYRFGLRMCGSEEDAKEVLQETLLAAFRGIHAFRGDAELSTWLYQVARTYCLRLRRRRVGAPEEFQPLDSGTGAGTLGVRRAGGGPGRLRAPRGPAVALPALCPGVRLTQAYGVSVPSYPGGTLCFHRVGPPASLKCLGTLQFSVGPHAMFPLPVIEPG